MRRLVLLCLWRGAFSPGARVGVVSSELPPLRALPRHLVSGDIFLGDRGFGNYPLIALLQYVLGVDFIGRTTRQTDGRRRLKRLARNDWLFLWKKGPKPSPWLSLLQWTGLPLEMTLRAVKGSCYQKGFRVRQVTVVTTPLDPQLYPAREILRA